MKVFALAFLGLVANVAAIELTADNYDAETDGKTVFIKFYAPWCGHCKKMKPDWDVLMKEFEGSDSQLVAEVDCTSDGGKPLCEANGVRGYPTLKWGDPASLEDYSGGRDLTTLKKFSSDKLKPLCSPAHLELCDKDQKKEIEKYLALGQEKLETEIKGKKAEIEKAEATFKEEVEALQNKYKDLMAKKEETIEAVKSSGLTIMEKCLNSLKKKKHDEL